MLQVGFSCIFEKKLFVVLYSLIQTLFQLILNKHKIRTRNCNFVKKRIQHKGFSVIIFKFLRTILFHKTPLMMAVSLKQTAFFQFSPLSYQTPFYQSIGNMCFVCVCSIQTFTHHHIKKALMLVNFFYFNSILYNVSI